MSLSGLCSSPQTLPLRGVNTKNARAISMLIDAPVLLATGYHVKCTIGVDSVRDFVKSVEGEMIIVNGSHLHSLGLLCKDLDLLG